MKNIRLIEELKLSTESLRTQYVENTRSWAKSEFNKILNITEDEFLLKYGTYSKFSNKNIHTKSSYSRWGGILNKKRLGEEVFIENEIEGANEHFESSIIKLANRILKEDVNWNNMEIITSHIGVNIETVIKCNNKIITASTTLVLGDIQKPHYRYFVKCK